ncbi:sulfatase-like hydrolase/transferase [Flammeovirgaceae bacterium SG7u.111]|nr:sulfatase-like hydrolase/transferase [Flammeovirgaceae bacterium SG7u.132]WPO33639.1 sulfatase-like hydrolase/transferase [Flammeovirgaceae bacterium SG7u.111]
MKRFRLLILGLAMASSIHSFAQIPTPEKKPNIILIMADDLGPEAIGSYGGTSYKTPRIDQLAETGAIFAHGYAYPLCTNTRVSLMTGKYNFRNWKAFGILDPKEKTFGHLLQEQGYKTCMVGKWQLQSYDPIGYPGAELRRDKGMKVENAGFDEYCMWHTRHNEDKGSRYPDPLIYQNGEFLQNTNSKYGPDIFVEYLNDFVKRNADDPFFIYYPMALTHNPFVPTPESGEWADPTLRHKEDDKFFGDMVEYTDLMVGKIIDQLDELGIRENTLVIFYSDNGTHQSITSQMGGKTIRGGKGKTIDDGTRVPLIVNWPAKVKKQVSNQFVAPSDFMPTLFEVIGQEIPSDNHTDGESFWPELVGEKAPQRRDWVFIDYNPKPGWGKDGFTPVSFVKGERYKLYSDQRFYDIEKDRLEEKPLDASTPKLKSIKEKYTHILDSLRRYKTFGEIQSFDPQFDKIVPPHSKIEIIAEGFNWSEGPVWVESEQCLLFSDVPENTIYKWSEMNGTEVFLKKSGYTGSKPRKGGKGSNGLALDLDGRLLLCRHGDREVARLASSFHEPVPVFESLITNYQGKKLNSPNDLVLDSKGNIYFTDPEFGLDKDLLPEGKELSVNGVYRLNTDGTLDLLVDNLEKPNGVALSPDEQLLYVANSGPQHWMVYDLNSKTLPLKGKIFFDGTELHVASISKQNPDGMDVNSEGIIFATGPDGVMVFSPEGKHLGTIYVGKHTSNCVLSDDEKTLYVTCDDYILRIIMGYEIK